MNYSGKFDAKVPVDSGLHSNGPDHVDTFSAHATHAPADAIVVPDAHLLFNGDFKRSGVDLVLSKDDQELVLHDYFKGEKRAALASPDGAHLTGEIVNALTGQVEYAQADGNTSVSKVIGHVTKLAGTATAVRNGVSIILNQGDNVEKGDVVQSGAGSTLGITFIDGTVFGLSSNARMVLNEMVYDPNGSNNSSLLSLVAGTITFVAGETAKHGDMKIDTPVATMGIRGTAVLVEIDFDVPGQAGLPDAKFQVLVEPDGTTGSYILFDKTTLTPLAVVNQAGQQINISNGTLTQSSTGLSSEIQKLITDVFSIKFTDTNTKTFDHHTDTPIPDSLSPFKVGVITALPIFVQLPASVNTAPSNSVALPNPNVHINQAPTAVILNASGQASTAFRVTELPGVTHSSAPDTASGKVSFVDINVGDAPTVATKFDSFTYQNAANTDVTATLSAQQFADIAAVEAKLTVVPAPGNSYFGSATWTYSVPDGAFDFLAKGETLTLTYDAFVDNDYLPSDLVTELKFTITITGTNDVPVITTGPQTINFSGGTLTPGGDLAPSSATPGVHLIHPAGTLTYKESGTLTFTDPDLTDTHRVVSTGLTGDLTGASLSGATLDLATLESKFPGPFQIFENALSASIATDSTGTGTGTISWTFAELPTYVADFIPSGETLTLTYTVEVEDSQGAIATQNVIVTITGSNAPAVVWIASVPQGATPGGLWSDASDWETGTVPTATDDVIIITNQLIGLTPSYPVTIDATTAAVAKTVTLNDFSDLGNAHPELINQGTLTIGGTFSLGADSTVENFGVITVGGLMEVSDTSALQNSNKIALQGGGDFIDQSSITNSGMIEISGGKLDVEVAIANAGGTIKVDAGATLKLNGAAINGGTITDNGTIDVTANSSINGTATSAVLNDGGVTVESGVTLTLDKVTVTGTTFNDTASGAILSVGATDTLTLSGVTINGGSINDGTGTTPPTSGKIEISGSSTISGASLNHGGVMVDANQTLTLDNDTVTGTTFTDTASGALIQVDDGTTLTLSGVTIDGGTVNDGTASGTVLVLGSPAVFGSIVVTGDSTISDASLNHGSVTIEQGISLTLTNDTVTGTSIEVDGAINAPAAGDLILQGGTILSGSQLTIDNGDEVTLNGATITGGTINDNGTIDVTGSSKIDGHAALNNGGVTIESGVTLTLDNITVFATTLTDQGTIVLDNTVKLTGGATLQGASTGVLGSITNNGTLEVAGAASLLNDTLTNTSTTGSIIQVDALQTLTLSGTEIIGGTINGTGTIDVTGDSKIDGNATLNNGAVTVESGKTLTLDSMTANGTTLTDRGTIVLDNTVKLTGGATLQGASISVLGSITNNGTLEVSGAASLLNDTLTNTSTTGSIIQVDALQTLTLSGTEIIGGTINGTGTIDVTGDSKIDSNATLNNGAVTVESGKILTLDKVTVTGTSIEIDGAVNTRVGQLIVQDGTTISGSHLTIDAGGQMVLNNATVTGGTITDNGKIDVTGNSSINGVTTGPITTDAILNDGGVTVESGVILTLDNVTVNGSVFTDIATNSTIRVDSGDTLAFNGATINGGTLNVLGEMDSSGISFITGATIVNVNNIVVVSGTLTIDPTPVTNTGTIEVMGGGTLKLSDDIITNTDGTNIGTIQVDAGPINPATLDLDKSTISGGTVIISGVLDSSGDSFITGAKITNSGTIDVISGTLVIDATSTLDNTGGTLKSDGGNLIIDTAFSGNLEIKGGAVLELGANSPYSSVTVTFDPDATGTLKLDHSEAFGGTVTGLDDNTIDLLDISSVNTGTTVLPTVTFDSKTDILTITSNVQLTQVAHIQLTGDYTGVTWSVTSDGNGGTDVTEVPGVIAGLDSNGNATEGSSIKASITDGGAAVTATYTWQIFENGAWVPGSGVADANGNYIPGEADEGHALRVFISYIDALNHSETATVSAGTVIGVPETPVVSTPDAQTTTENQAAIHLTGLNVTPADASANDAADTFNVTLSVNDGSLALAGDSGLSGTFSGASITFSGSLAAVNAALSGVSYTPTSEFEGQDTLTFTSSTTEEASAGGGTSAAATQTATITVNPIAEAGTASAPATLTLTENATGVAITGVTVGPLAEDSDDTVSAALTVGHGTVHVNNNNLPAGVTVTGDDSGSLTISGNAAAVNTLLQGLTYTPTTEFNGSDTLHVTVTSKDGSNTSPTQGTASTAITVSDGPNDLVATLDHTTAQQGVTMDILGVTDGGITVATGLSYEWQDSTNNGWQTVGTGSSYTPGESDEGKLMQLVVTYVDAGGSESSIYSLGMPNDLTMTVDSTHALKGTKIHVTGVSDGGTIISTSSDDLSYAWQHSSDNGETWQTVGTSKSYTPNSSDAGDLLQVVVTYADSDEQESVTTSFGAVATKVWSGGSHHWQTASHWSPSGAPASSDYVLVNASGTYTVTISQAAAAHSLVVNDSGARVEITGSNTLTLGGDLTIQAGNLLIDSGGTLKDIATSATIAGTFTDNGFVEAAVGKLEIASAVNSGSGSFKIDAGATLQFDHADSLNVAFTGSGVLILNDPTHFTGTISDSGGSMTAADVLDLHGFAATTTTASTGSGSFHSTTGTTTLTVTDSSDNQTETFTLAGNLSNSTWTVTDDGHGGANIVDPLGTSIPVAATNPAASTIAASAPNQTLTGNAVSDTFVFNFANVGNATVTNFHTETDTLQFNSQMFANIQAALNATHDDGHGNTVVALDAHDTITLSGVLKAQLHASDFHFV